jgi:colanic acid biosynthesis glycosyl transferase WcaI
LPKILVLYHYYHPDDVVSAQQFTGLCEGLSQKGFQMEVWPANRACHDPKVSYSTKPDTINGVIVRRVWRPNFRQHSFFGRIINSIWIQKYWWLRLAFSSSYKPDLILTGTDPLFSVFLIPFLKFLRPKAKIAQWCFDLYPEAAIADGIVKENNLMVKGLRFFLKKAYKKCDLIADLGSCMRIKLERYGIGTQSPSPQPSPLKGEGVKGKQKVVTLTPWALEESAEPLPIDTQERTELFGDGKLGLLYSGSFGRAHDFYLTLKLARSTSGFAAFIYSVRGSRLDELKLAVNREDTNVRFVDFAPPERLAARLSAPDVHVVSLRPEWTGMVVPSKFFGALAAGRPVLFEGSEDSSISKWITEYKVGWVLTPSNLQEVAADLLRFSGDPKRKTEMFKHCHSVYQAHFSKRAIVEGWNRELRALLV